ncbi:MAG: glycosyltransferase [Treponema sp.]|jgi:glycosyltransferase involved in cell wall biosynthesis|nr:glycosyltransferase [Treponema sp.]
MKIIQVMDALDYGDAVSGDLLGKDKLLNEMGFQTAIYTKYAHESMESYRRDISELSADEDDILLYHYCGDSCVLTKIFSQKCKKVLIYHNITPPEYFNTEYEKKLTSSGLEQLKIKHGQYDYFAADSEFNKNDLIKLGVRKEISVLPLYINFDNLSHYKAEKKARLRNERVTFLFVGRIAANKKHKDVINIFNYYHTNINKNSRLFLVGNYQYAGEYFHELTNYVASLGLKEYISFEGKVSDGMVCGFYAAADIFICMSEHEGFCAPLLESMYMQLPTIAYDAGAISSTMGSAGVLVKHKDYEQLAKLCHVILSNESVRDSIISAQNKWITTFSKENIKERLKELIKEWENA